MPFIRVSYLKNQYSPQQLSEISETIMKALIAHFNVPKEDYFQVFHAHQRHEFYYSPNYLDIERSDGLLYIQITLKSGRTQAQKTSFYAELAEQLASTAGIRPQDVFVVLVGSEYEDWTFGNGIAQMLSRPAGKTSPREIRSTARESLAI